MNHYTQNTEQLLKQLFPQELDYQIQANTIKGWAVTNIGRVRIIGTVHAAAMNHSIALDLSREILSIIKEGRKTPVVFIVDTQGQDLSRADEVLCLNGSFAHLASCVELLRQYQHPNLAIIFGQAVSGGFLSYGLMANEIYAFQDSQVKVMDLNAMARVTKIAVETLSSLSQHSPIFAPGVDNFYKMGAITAIWQTPVQFDVVGQALADQLAHIQDYQQDNRRVLAKQRQGRLLCQQVIEKILID